jgi:hypothetical protein
MASVSLQEKHEQNLTMGWSGPPPGWITMADSTQGIARIMLPAPLVAVALAPLVAWRVYSRVKRLTTRQHSRTWRHRTTLVFFPLLLLMVGWAALSNPLALLALLACVVVGSLLGVLALSKSVFEQEGDQFYFTPHARIGMIVALLFLGRMAWRAWEFYTTRAMGNHDFVRSPLTLAVFGILAGYYMTYALGLLRWRKGAAPAITQG